jgi:hypothetical protein
MEAVRFSETSVHMRTTRRYIPEDGNFHNHRFENLKLYIDDVFHSPPLGLSGIHEHTKFHYRDEDCRKTHLETPE